MVQSPSGRTYKFLEWFESGKFGNATVAIVLLLVTLIAAQDFYLVDYSSGVALKDWWVDASFHVKNINILTHLMQKFSMTGYSESELGLYHFLGYFPAALGSVIFDISGIKSYAIIYAPLGIFLFAYGIWMFSASLWSREHALWATVFFLLLPDVVPYLMPSHDFFLIKWLVSVSPGLGYGVFVSALSWVFCLRGIQERKPGLIALGWFICLLTIFVKAHLFVANALPLVVYTIAFYPGLERNWRGILLSLFLMTYLVAVKTAESFLSIPLIRLNFSNAAAYVTTLKKFEPPDAVSSWILHLVSDLHPYIVPVGLMLALLILHFGPFLVLVSWSLRKDLKKDEINRWLPALAIFAVYILHATGLSWDTRPYTYSGEPMELIHRPFIWGVSLIIVWTFASLASNYQSTLTLGRRWALCLLLIPFAVYSYNGMQFKPRWQAPTVNYSEEYFQALHFLEKNAARNELVQAADLDPYLTVEAITGHTAYATKYVMQRYPAKETLERAEEVLAWLSESDSASITSFATQKRIGWLVVHDSMEFSWPREFISTRTRFKKNGVVVIQLLHRE